MEKKLNKADILSLSLPYNIDMLYVGCKAGECDVFYPVKRITDEEHIQDEYMREVKDFYQEVLDNNEEVIKEVVK